MSARFAFLLLGGFMVLGGCRPTSPVSRSGEAELSARGQRLTTSLANAGMARRSALAKWILPREMGEISGLALTSDGRLLAHGDETGRVYVIDPRRGALLKRFSIGSATDVRADFEGITTVEGRIVMVASDGMLYEFAEGDDGERVGLALEHDDGLRHPEQAVGQDARARRLLHQGGQALTVGAEGVGKAHGPPQWI